MKEEFYRLGRLRRQLDDGGGGWPDEIAESVMPSFMKVVDALVEGGVTDEAIIADVRGLAEVLAGLSLDTPMNDGSR